MNVLCILLFVWTGLNILICFKDVNYSNIEIDREERRSQERDEEMPDVGSIGLAAEHILNIWSWSGQAQYKWCIENQDPVYQLQIQWPIPSR